MDWLNGTFFKFSLIAVVSILTVFIACKREGATDLRGDSRAKYVSPALLTVSDHDLINDHKRFIALGVAELVNNNTLANLQNSIFNIENYLDGYTSVDIAVIKNIVSYSNSAYLVPNAGNGNEFGDAINYAVTSSSPENGNIVLINNNTWDWAMLEGYINNGVTFRSYIEIPDYQSLTAPQKAKPIVVVPKVTDLSEEMIFPVTGYRWDAVNSKIVQQIIADESELYDPNSPFYIWLVDYGAGTKPDAPSTKSCTGDFAPLCGDDYCDEECGEVWPDCADCIPDKNKKLKIKKYAALIDNRVRNICTSGSGEKWREMTGNYKIAFGCIIETPAGFQKTYTGSFGDCSPLKRSSVHLCHTKLIGCGNSCNNGGATWSEDYPKSTTALISGGYGCAVPVLDHNFNPKKSEIYIYFYEDDYNKLPFQLNQYTLTVQKTGFWSIPMPYYSKHTPFGVYDVNGRKSPAASYTEYVGSLITVTRIKPTDWQDWSLNPIVPSTDEIEIITPNGDFKYVLTYE